MASWLYPEKKSNQNLLPPLRQKSRIPVRVTHLSGESDRSLDEKALLHRDSDRKLQNKRPSRIPIAVDEKKNKVDTKENLPVYVKIQGEEPLGKHSGIKLKDTQGKEEKKKASTISSTAAKYGSYRRAKETMPNVRRRIPRQLTPLETDSKQVCSDEKEPREESSAGEVSSSARTEDVTPDFECNVAPVLEEELRIGAEADFSGSEFGDDFERHSKSSDEKAMPNVPPWLREECKKREEITLNKNIVKDDTAVTNAAQNIRLEPELDTEDKVDKCGLSEEELDCSSFTESSGYKRKMAELDEKSRRLKAQFAEENRQAIESMNKIVEEIKQSQAREDSITNEIQEMRLRQDEIKDDLKRLDEIGQRRELEDKKWRERMEKKKKKVARRLEKIRAERRKYQEETADEDGSTEEHEQPNENLNENREGEKCKHVTMKNKTVVSEEIDDNKVLYEPHEIKEYKSVKELEKKRKKLRRLERLEKKAIKREKLEQRERKKIEKQKRKVARKLEKLSGKTSKISEGTSETSKCINQPMEASNTTTKENFDETPRVSKSKPCTDKTSDGKESKQVQAAHFPGLPTNGVEVEKIEEKLAEVENKQHIASDSGAPAKVGSEKESYSDAAKKKEKVCDYPDEQIKRIDDNTDAEVVSAGREDTLDDISIEELGLEQALNFDQERKGEIQMEPENRDFLSDNSGPVLSRTGCQEPFRQEKEQRPQGEPVAMSHVSYFPSPDCSKHDEYRAADEPVYEDVSVSNCEKNNGYGDYKRDLFSSFSPVTDQTSPLTRKTSGRFTSFDLQPLCRSPEMGEENPVLEDSHSNANESLDSEHTSQNYRNEEVPLQLDNRSTENKENSGEDQSELMSKGSHNHNDETPEQVKCPVTYQTAPLTRKVSERFTPFWLQLSWRSPEMAENNLTSENSDSIVDESVESERIDQNDSNEEVPQQLVKISPENRENDIQDQSQLMREESHSHKAEDNQILQDTDSTVDKLVNSEHSNKKYSNEEVPQQLENRFAGNEVRSNNDDANHTNSSDILEGFEGTLSERTAPCSDDKTDKDTDSEISCREETRRSLKTDLFSDVIKEAGDESRNKKALTELIQEELISSSESPAKCSLAVENGNNNERPLKGEGSSSHKDDICDQFKDRDQLTSSSFHSPELGAGNEKLEVTASTTDQLEGNKESVRKRPNLKDSSYMTTNNIKSYNDANDTSCNDIPEELEEILLVSGVSSHTEEESVYETNVQVICKEEDSCTSSSDALSTPCRGEISMGAYETKTERRKENVVSDESGQMCNVDNIIDDTETAPQQLEKELAEKEDKSCNNADDAVHSDRPKATPDNSSSVQNDDKAGEKQKMTENKENYWKEAEVLVKYSDASFDDKKGSLSSIDDKGDSVLQQHKTKVCNFDSLNDKKRKKVSDDMAKFSPDKENSIEDEFIEDFDRFLDEVEEDILTEESMSQISHSAENECSALPSYERSVAAVVNISEYLFQQEFSKALETTLPDSKKEYTSQSEKSSEEELELEKRKYLAKDVYRSEDVAEYRYVIGIALDKLNHINSVLTDAGEQFLDRRIKHRRCAVHGDIDSGTRLLNSIDVLNDNVKGAVKDFKLAIQMTEVEPKFHKENDVVKLGQIRKENTELEIQISVIKEELETYQKRIENLQADLDESKDEVRRLQLREEYKERELSNLKRDIQSKERKWEEGNETVEKVMGDIKELWDDVDFLEESLKNSQKSNEDLMFQVDELKKTIKEMKKEYWMEHSRGGCGHLREEVELLNGSLELKEQRLVLLEGQQARQFSQHAVKDKELRELKDENLRVVSKLEDQLAKLSRENSALATELLKVSGKDDEVGEVKDETSTIIEHLRKVKVELGQENYMLTSELSQALVENESLKKANGQVSNMMRQFEDELARLKKEHSMTDLRASSDENNRWNGIKEETFGVVRQLENKISRLLKENLTIAVKLSEKSEHKTQLNELKYETTKTIGDLNDEIAKLQREKSILSSELSAKESDKNNQLYELRCEKWKIERKLEGEITDLSRENSTLTARLSAKASETNDKLKELREQLVALSCNNSALKEELMKTKNRSAKDLESVHNDSCEFAQDEKCLSGGQKKKSPEIKVLKKRVRRSERELVILRKFLRQRGLDFGERLTSVVDGDVTSTGDEEVSATDTLHLSREVRLDEGKKYKVQETEKTIRDLRQTLQQTERTLEHTNSALRLKTEKTDILERCLKEKEEMLQMKSQQSKQDIEQTEGTLRWQKERTEELKVQLKNLTEAAEAFMKSKAKEVEEANCCIKEQDETIKNLLEEIRQERCDKDRRVLQSERIGELETQLQRMEEMKRSTVHRIDALVLEVRKQRSEKERLKRVIEAKECTCCEDKDLMKITENQENQLRKKDDLTNATLTLNNNKRSLQEANSTIDMLHKQLEREKSDNENLRRALKASEHDTNERNRLTQKIEKLENQLQEMDDLRENTLRSLQGKEWSLEEARNKIKELTREIAREKSDKEYFKKKVDAGENTSNRLKLVKKETIRKAEQTGCLMAQVGKGLRNLVQRQREVYASSLIMKKTEAYTASVVEKLRKDLNDREESVKYLRSCSQDSANECSFMRRLLEDIQCENAHLKRCLGDKDEKVRMLETIAKQLEEDLQKTQKYLKEKEVGFVDANETLRLKCSLLTTMEAKLCLRNKEIDELTQENKEKSLELTRIETTLREVKKELDITASIIEKQNEQCANLKNCAVRKTRDAEEMHDELKRLSTQLVCSKEEKCNLHRAVLAATSRLEYESKQFWDMKMDLREAAARISVLEDEKEEQEENLAAFKGKVSRELDLLKETRHGGNEESSSLQLTIGSAEREIAKLTKENQKQFRIELLHNGLENKSSESSCEESTFRTLETTRGKALAASSQGDTQSKWVNNSRFEKRFETRGDNRFNRTGTITTRGSSNTVSILLYNG
ncbi:centromere-associated protein E-like [Pocillopora damicornis]|uniref:centromere-associated protein E-like n=1 Tax=Pocillopora damicornis TaxID=46731 RepID=UPI000F54CBDC|nr:centromere-associated protein E-like [Pocillopora damicornis]